MPNHCVFCGRMKGPDLDISLFRVPKQPVFRKEWLDGLNLTEEDLTAESRVCSLHFPDGKATNTPSASLGARPPEERPARGRKRRGQASSSVSQPKRRRQHTQQASSVSDAAIDHTKCYITTSDSQATTLKEMEFTLHARDREGKPTSVQAVNATAKLVCYQNNKIVECDIKEVHEDKCIFQCQVFSPGTHHLCITIGGKEISGCPHAIEVNTLKPVRIIDDVDRPTRVITDSQGRIIVTEKGADCVSIFTPEGEKVQLLGSGENGNGQFNFPRDVTVDGDDNIYYVTGYNNCKIHKFTPNGDHVTTAPTNDSSPLQFHDPCDIAFNSRNNKLYVCDQCLSRIQVLNTDLSFSRTFGSKGHGNGQFDVPFDISFDSDGNVYVADCDNNRIQVFTPEGQYLRKFGRKRTEHPTGHTFLPTHLAISHNKVWVTTLDDDDVSVFTTTGNYLGSFKPEGNIMYVHRVAIDKNGALIVCGYGSDPILVYHM